MKYHDYHMNISDIIRQSWGLLNGISGRRQMSEANKKIGVYKSDEEKKLEDEKPLMLKLVECDGYVSVEAVDGNSRHTLMTISKAGIYRTYNFTEKFGVALDAHGRVIDRTG